MDISNSISQWLISRLELMPAQILQQMTGARSSGRLLDVILGEREAVKVRALLDRGSCRQSHISTVLLPGVMGSLLTSIRGISALIWPNSTILVDGQINLLDLDHSGTGDRSPDVEIVPVGIETMTYLRLILTLARDTRLYEFPYDWRRPLEWNADILRAALQRWSSTDPSRRYTLVGHSMGGMLARTYLARYPGEAEKCIERLIMLGTPLFGAPITALLFSGQTIQSRIVQRLNCRNDVVGFASNLPSSYQLLPPPREMFGPERSYPTNWDLYDAAAWGLPNVRQDYLDRAREWHVLMTKMQPQVELVEIVGCHQRTLTDVWQSIALESTDTDEPQYTLVHSQSGEESGDGTVPLWSTTAPGVTTYYVEEGHQTIPSNPHVLEAIRSLVIGGPISLPTELPAPRGILRHLAPKTIAQQVAELRKHIENGRLTREDLEKILFAR